jgi:hypothetical protein
MTSRTSTPKNHENVTSINNPVMTLNESALVDIKGKEHNETHATALEPSYRVLAGTDEVTRLLESIKLANSATEDNCDSINSASHKLDGENGPIPVCDSKSIATSEDSVQLNGDELDARSQSGKNSRPGLKFVEISEDSIRSNEVGPDGESEEELDTDLEYESEEPNNDSEYESEDESNDDSEDESGFKEDTKRSCKLSKRKATHRAPGRSCTFLRKISEFGEDCL